MTRLKTGALLLSNHNACNPELEDELDAFGCWVEVLGSGARQYGEWRKHGGICGMVEGRRLSLCL